MMLLLYMYNFLESKHYTWGDGPTVQMLQRGTIFPERLMSGSPLWFGLGAVINAISLIWSGLVSVIVVFYSETALDVILNSLALFFIFDIDDQLVDKYDYERNKNTFETLLKDVKADLSLTAVRPYRSFKRTVPAVDRLVTLMKLFVLVSVPFMAVCK